MNFEDIFVPEITTTEPIKASVGTTTSTDTILIMPEDILVIPETTVFMPDEIVTDNLETTSTENMVLAPKDESQNKKLEIADLLPWDEQTKDIILMSVTVACLILAIVLGIVTFKWRKEKLNAEKFNGTKIE